MFQKALCNKSWERGDEQPCRPRSVKRGSEVVLRVILLQSVEKTMGMQVITLQPMKDPGGEDNQPAEDPMLEQVGVP